MDFVAVVALLGLGMLAWDCIEVGRNDAANLINAVFGARVMSRRAAVYLAGGAVVLGATFASPVMETVRKGIFDPSLLTLEAAVTVYITAYVVDTVLLYSFSAFGMPVSTTATLVFSLVGAAFGVMLVTAGPSVAASVVHWGKVGTVGLAIILSILLSGCAGFLIQRAFRGAIQDDAQDPERVRLHGPWIAGLMLTWLSWFMLLKGLKGVAAVKVVRDQTLETYGAFPALLLLWTLFAVGIYAALSVLDERGPRYLFHGTAVLGMVCMAFAFGQNDLANCASPGLSALWLYQHSSQSVAEATKVPIPMWSLFGCGMLMALGMSTRNAQRVTRAAVNTGSQADHVALWAPRWTRALARRMVTPGTPATDIAPPPATTAKGKSIHYDTLRASVIMAVSASVIAFASSRGLPVSTTYVGFAAVVATGWGDRVFQRGDADLKIGRAIWVATSWFLAVLIAMASSAVVAFVIYALGIAGLVLALAVNLWLRFYLKRRSDAHERRHHPSRATHPEPQQKELPLG